MYSSKSNSHQGQVKCQKCNKEEEKRLTIELKLGRVTNHTADKSNKISTTSYTAISFLPKTIVGFFTKIGNLFFLIVSLIMLIWPSLSPFKSWIVISPLIFYLLLFMAKEFYLDYLRYKNDRTWNLRKCARGFLEDVEVLKKKKSEMKRTISQKQIAQSDQTQKVENKVTTRNTTTQPQKSKSIKLEGSNLEEINWEDVRIGDVLKLSNEEFVPADMILLDSNNIRDNLPVCFISTLLTEGKEDLKEIRSSNLTRISQVKDSKKSYFNKYKTRLNLKLIYETPNPEIGQFFGQLRLKKDPKIEQLSADNFIPRGSQIILNKEKDWIFGLVVYTGMDTKIMFEKQYYHQKSTHIENLIKSYFFTNICLISIFAIISIIVIAAKSKDLSFLLKVQPSIADSVRFFTYIILYSQMIPISIYILSDIILLGSAFLIEHRMRKQKKVADEVFKIKNANVFSNLGQIDYMFLDKIGVPINGKKQICRVMLLTDDYIFNPNELKKEVNEQRWNKAKETKIVTLDSPLQTAVHKETDQILQEDMLIPSEHNLSILKTVKKGRQIDNQIVFQKGLDSNQGSNASRKLQLFQNIYKLIISIIQSESLAKDGIE